MKTQEQRTTSIINEIKRERYAQVGRGFDATHDDSHPDGVLSGVAVDVILGQNDGWGILKRNEGDLRRQRIIAAALILAEIERMDREGEKA